MTAFTPEQQAELDRLIDAKLLPSTTVTRQLQGRAWVGVAFNSGWSSFGSGFQAVQYAKDGNGVVRLRGLITKSSTISTGPETMFTLPAGFAPASPRVFNMLTSAGAQQVKVDGAGNVVTQFGTAAPVTNYVSLDGFIFTAD